MIICWFNDQNGYQASLPNPLTNIFRIDSKISIKKKAEDIY